MILDRSSIKIFPNSINTFKLEINNIQIWHDIHGRKFSDEDFNPVKVTFDVFELPRASIEILKKLIDTLLNGYGWSESDKYEFFQNIENKLVSISSK